MKYILSALLIISLATSVAAQDLNPVTWTYNQENVEDGIALTFTAQVEDGWYVYAQEIAENGPIPTSFNFENAELEGIKLEESSANLVAVYDEMFGMDLKKYKKQVVFTCILDKGLEDETISGYLEFMCCNNTECLPPRQIEFTFNLK